MYATEYVADNWILILVLLGFTISLISTVFIEQKTIRRLYALIVEVFLLSIVVFAEFKMDGMADYRNLRIVLMAIRYSATPLLVAQIVYTVAKGQKWYLFIPAGIFTALDFISIPTGIVFALDDANKLVRGPLGMLPYVGAGVYGIYLVYNLWKRHTGQRTDTVPIVFFAFAFSSGIMLPFIIGKEYAQVFCATIAVSMFVYYVFTLLQLTKRDPLTGLLNRQAYYADTRNEPENINALVSVDMNGLKAINDNEGHKAGDEALTTLAGCFIEAAKLKYRIYRVGGDEFVIVCRKCKEQDVQALASRIHENVAKTKYSCSVGYCYSKTGSSSIDEMLTASDENMYAEKMRYYKEKGITR